MTDRAKKVSELTATSSVASNDYLVIVTDTTGTPTTKRVTVNNFFGNTSANLYTQKITAPANSIALSVKQGAVFYDSNYLYVAIANNNVKRVLLESF
jgi:hypothetical protein